MWGKWRYKICEHRLGIKPSHLPRDPHTLLGSASHPAPKLDAAVLQWFYSHLSQNYVPWQLLDRNFHPSDNSLPQLWRGCTAFFPWWNTAECCYTALACTAVCACTTAGLCFAAVHFCTLFLLRQYLFMAFFLLLLLWYNLKMWHPAMFLEIKFLIMNFLAFVSLPQILNISNVIFMRISMLF